MPIRTPAAGPSFPPRLRNESVLLMFKHRRAAKVTERQTQTRQGKVLRNFVILERSRRRGAARWSPVSFRDGWQIFGSYRGTFIPPSTSAGLNAELCRRGRRSCPPPGLLNAAHAARWGDLRDGENWCFTDWQSFSWRPLRGWCSPTSLKYLS